MSSCLFYGGRFLDPRLDQLRDGIEVLVEDGTIKEVSDRPISSIARRIDLHGRTLMPGLIDAHIHIMLPQSRPPQSWGRAADAACGAGRGRDAHHSAARLHDTARYWRRGLGDEGGR